MKMPSFSMLFFVVCVFSLFISFPCFRSEDILGYYCSESNNFTTNSTYHASVKHLLSSLSSNATTLKGFYNTTTGQNPDTVYGLFLCRGDVTTDVCRDCISSAIADVLQYCPNQKEAIVWYDKCLLRYANRNIFSTMEKDPFSEPHLTSNVTDQDKFNKLLASTAISSATKAANAPSAAKKFATAKMNFTEFQTVYILMQCTPDLSSLDCSGCLRGAIADLPDCCGGKRGARVLYPSCFLRYELYPFYDEESASAPDPTALILPASQKGKNQETLLLVMAIGVPVTVSVVLFCVGYCILTRRRGRKKSSTSRHTEEGWTQVTTVESLQFDLGAIQAATNNFSDDNMLGQGGFGGVYKGILPDGQEIAVKRLSRSSVQGEEEFKNEVLLVAKLQHRNLARLLGFCLEGNEKILVYEFVPNKSLDNFLFDLRKRRQLDWSTRYRMVEGIARGILYLHQDSRLRVIHRDLKASNILLDTDMNPKVSDFGMAKIFRVDQSQGNTSRIVGTFGYIAPEYAMHGRFSMKSDVYSFDILILEIISGKRNNNFSESNSSEDLVSHAWNQWRKGEPFELLDPTLSDSYSRNQVIRCINIALLCVQEDPAERPTMAAIVLMLDSHSITLPIAQQPALLFGNGAELEMPTNGLDLFHAGHTTSNSVDKELISDFHPG